MTVRRALLTCLTLAGTLSLAAAQPPAAPKPLTPEQQVKLKERDKHERDCKELEKAGKLKEAILAAEKMLALEREVYGSMHEEIAGSLFRIDDLAMRAEDWAKAREARAALLKCQAGLYGKNDWRVTDARLALADVGRFAALSRDDRTALMQAKVRNGDVVRFYGQGKYSEAIVVAKEVLAVRRRLLGDTYSDSLLSVNNLALLYKAQGHHAEAEPFLKEALAGFRKSLGDAHPLTLNSVNNLAVLYQDQGRHAEAEPLYKDALAGRRKALGDTYPDILLSINNLASLYRAQSRHAKAEPLLKEALAGYRKASGDAHPSTLGSVNNLASLYQAQGRHVEAEPLLKDALAGYRKALGDAHPDTLTSVNNLAALYHSMGRYAEAEPLYKEALAGYRKALGDAHTSTLPSVNNLALLYHDQGRHAEAEPFYKEALAGYRKALGAVHPSTLTSVNNLAGLYQAKGRHGEAEPLFKEALAGRRKALGDAHPSTLTSVHNLAGLYQAKGRYSEAEPLYKEALAGYRKALGDAHPSTLGSVNNLASLYQAQGRHVEAEPLLKDALAGYRKALGDAHPDTLTSVNNLAALYHSMGRYAEAEPLAREALAGITDHLERTAVIQSETAQLANVAKEQWHFTAFLRATTKVEAAATYALVLRWRGAVTARQTFARAARAVDPAAQGLLAELAAVSRQIAVLANNPPPPEKKIDIPARMKELNSKRDDLEAQLAARSASFAGYVQHRALRPADLQKSLPADAALVDYVEYGGALAAFVVRKDGIVRVELGPGKPVAAAADGFRQTLWRTRPTTGKLDDPAVVLRKAVWEPLAKRLNGAKIVLVCPEGPLGRVPFAALPGSDPEKYLIEEVALAVVPVPRLLPELLAERVVKRDAPPSLLAVGDVDFDALPLREVAAADEVPNAQKRVRAGSLRHWDRLPGTAGEVAEIETAFRAARPNGILTVLRSKAATETAVRLALGKYEYLHLATHGFFADPSASPVIPTAALQSLDRDRPRPVGPHPGLLSGLAFAGANKPHDNDDGVLTALEVADLDLSKVELAVLSACETGLGATAGGEGVLGLQRAFQMAGARTTVTSLWKVSDRATQELMTRVYRAWWGVANIGRLEALRQTQLWMLREGASIPGLTRGATADIPDSELPKPGGRLPPFYWAAFVLAGDWR